MKKNWNKPPEKYIEKIPWITFYESRTKITNIGIICKVLDLLNYSLFSWVDWKR